MNATRITLQVGDVLTDFEASHAERILQLPNNGGWHLPEDSGYQFDEINGITARRNTGKTKAAESNAVD